MTSASNSAPEAGGVHGGSFIHEHVAKGAIFTPEQFTEEHRQLRKTADDFAKNEVEPWAEDIDHKKPGITQKLFAKAAELGFFMADVPEAYGGLQLDKVSGMLIAEAVSRVGSFSVTVGAHTGIGTLPIVYYGTREQKEKYLPRLAAGEIMGAYALSEAGSGSDALAAKTVARLSDDGKHYVLNGVKAWITNAAWADLFTVFAQVDGDKFTAFLVERSTPGVSIGNEERKLGIRGSSTCTVNLDDVAVPVENVLGEVGRGHKIAFNILNIGRWKLGVAAVGGAKAALAYGVRYAKERHQFKKPIATFGLIRQKIAGSATSIYAAETMAYRLAGNLDSRLISLDRDDDDYPARAQAIIEDYTLESSILKVFGSEMYWNVVDEMLQVHGGNGFTEDYPLERMLRDARINRIFEGTNEINRLIVPTTLFKWALEGRIPLLRYSGEVISQLDAPDTLPQLGEGSLAHEVLACELAKRAVVYAASYAAQKYMADLKGQQRLLGGLADCLIDLYGMDSVVARALQVGQMGGSARAAIHCQLTQLYVFDARARIFQRLRRIAMMMAEGEGLDTLYANLAKLDRRYRVDFMALQDAVAGAMLDHDGYAISD